MKWKFCYLLQTRTTLEIFWDWDFSETLSEKKVQKPSLGLYLFKRENFCPFWVLICTF